MPDQTSEITLGGVQVVVMNPADYPLAANLPGGLSANSFRCPVGESFGEGYLLLFRDELENKLSRGGPYPLVFNAGESVELKRVWVRTAHRVNYGGDPDDPAAVYLAHVVDCRYFLKWTSSARMWNVRNLSGADPNRKYFRETVPALETPWTWAQVLSQLWADCGLAGFPGIQGAGGFADDDLVIQGGNAWRFLNACVSKLGRTVAYNPIRDAFTLPLLVRDSEPLDRDVAASGLLFDARPYGSSACIAPEYIRIIFQKKWEDYGSEPDSDAEKNWLADAIYRIDIPTGIAGSIGGTVQTLWASAPAMVKHKTKDNIVNGGELNGIAQRMAAAWLYENAGDRLARANVIVNGSRAKWLPGESIREVIWRSDGDGLVTEIVKYPGLPTEGERGGEREFDTFSENDLGRKTTPNYPRLPNIVQIDDQSAAAGASIKPTKEGLHPGRVWRFVEGKPQKQEECWIQFVNSWDTKKGDIEGTNGEFYGPARLSGREESGGQRKPLYVVRRDSDSEGIIRFRLKEDLETGKSAKAVRIVKAANGYQEKEAIRVFDWYTTPRGMWQAKETPGYGLMTEGFAMRREVQPAAVAGVAPPPEYDVVWMETYAWTIEFELVQNMAGGDLAAGKGNVGRAMVLSAYEQGKDPSDANGRVLVFDDQILFPYALKGCRGIATRSEFGPFQPYYKIVQCQQQGFLATAELYESTCTAVVPGGAVKIKKETFFITTFSPFNAYPVPIPEEVDNPYKHSAPENFKVSLRFKPAIAAGGAGGLGRWIIDDIEKRELQPVTGNRIEGMCFKEDLQLIATEFCAPDTDRTWHCGTNCTGEDMGGDDEGGGGGSGSGA